MISLRTELCVEVAWTCGQNGLRQNVEEGSRTGCESVRCRVRPQVGWMYSVKKVQNIKEMFVEQGRVIMCDRDEWRAAVTA